MTIMTDDTIGYQVGETCGRDDCVGEISLMIGDEVNCSCHINPPCAKCTSGTYCSECGWESE